MASTTGSTPAKVGGEGEGEGRWLQGGRGRRGAREESERARVQGCRRE